MEMGLGAVQNGPQEVAAANHPQIRLYSVPKVLSARPLEVNPGTWSVCTPANAGKDGWGGFSAVGYFFGREIHQQTKVPIGLIQSAWGGTIAEAWVSQPGLELFPEFHPVIKQLEEEVAGARRTYEQRVAAWYQTNDSGEKAGWQMERAATGWTPASSANFADIGLANWDGIVWFRNTFNLDGPSDDLILELGMIDDADTVWVNGVQVGQTWGYDTLRRYAIPRSALRSGENVVHVRVLDTTQGGGLWSDPSVLRLVAGSRSVQSLAQGWQFRKGVSFASLPAFPLRTENNPNVPTVLSNAMVAPVTPFAIRGAIWYQGESNGNRGYQYRTLLPALIADWRRMWDQGDFPFYIVQLAPWQARVHEPRESDWAELREAQLMTALRVPNSGIAVTTDIGDADDIHPANKKDVGLRLARIALAKDYGRSEIVYSGPIYTGMTKSGGVIRLKFDHAKGLRGDLSGFAIAGADRKFVWANARIMGEEVWVNSPKVADPVAVRFGWDINPASGLFNEAGLPASPFRTDDWPGLSVGRK
jgi:sialate O-acetylesterase